MKIARIFAISGTLIMFFSLIYGFVYGDFFAEGKIISSMPWGHVSLIDVYVGFAIVGGWIIYRENNIRRSILWIAGLFFLGNFIACLYIWIAVEKANGDVKKFWFNQRIIENSN
jgi:uncharacterized membrane protein